MAHFKGTGEAQAPAIEGLEGGLFREFDPYAGGGLVLAAARLNGQVHFGVAELCDPYWKGGDPDVKKRISYFKHMEAATSDSDQPEAEWRGPEFDPRAPTLGWEREMSITYNGKPWRITDSLDIIYPNGSRQPLKDQGLDPEGFAYMIEDKAPVPANGYEELVISNVKGAADRERWLEEHGLQTPNLTLHPHKLGRDDRNTLLYVTQTLDVMDRQANAADFTVMSHQLTIGMHSPEAGAHALNKLQTTNALYSFLTGAGAVSDSSFETTIGEHYNVGREHELPQPGPGEWHAPVLQEDDILKQLADITPYDWRELLRETGSPSSGSLAKAAPTNLRELLEAGDKLMADKENPIVSVVRTIGLHTDRIRLDHGAIELSALGTSGGNLYLDNAVKELAAKQAVALQVEYINMIQAERAAQKPLYDNGVEIGHLNNILMAVNGREARLGDMNSQPISLEEMLHEIMAYVGKNSPEPLSGESRLELLAKFSGQGWRSECETAGDVFDMFFQPQSPMTATEALHYAHELEPHRDVDDMLALYSDYRRRHVYEAEKVYMDI